MRRSVVVLVVLLALSSPVLSGRPPASLATNTATGGDGPSVQSFGSSDSAQPVNVMNWLLDENGNLKVSMQVRDEVRTLVPGETTIAPESQWDSEWIDVRRYNVLRLDFQYSNLGCWLVTSWFEGHEYATEIRFADFQNTPIHRWEILGPQVRLRCRSGIGGGTIRLAAMYLRAE